MLPLTLLNTAQSHPVLVELKSGETLNGHLVASDNFMNLTLKEVVQTSPDGAHFFRLPECYIKGNTIKLLNIPDEVMDIAKEEASKGRQYANHNGNRGGGHFRGGHSDRGHRGGGGGGGRGGHMHPRGGMGRGGHPMRGRGRGM